MNGRLYLSIVALALCIAINNRTASAQSFPLLGRVISNGTNVSATSTATVFTTPSSRHFVLTQFCGGSSMILSGGTFGNVASLTTDRLCYSFNPGYAMPQNEAIQCTNPISGGSWCSISGVSEK
jgi:hypothetical protein